MKSTFYIMLSVKSVGRYECFGEFFLGNDGRHAEAVFSQLKGQDESNKQAVLNLDLVEIKEELPATVKTIYCTLDDLATNTKLITREVFRRKTLAFED